MPLANGVHPELKALRLLLRVALFADVVSLSKDRSGTTVMSVCGRN
jgi:hypothetical protein